MDRIKIISALTVLVIFLMLNTIVSLGCYEDRSHDLPILVLDNDDVMPLDKFLAIQEAQAEVLRKELELQRKLELAKAEEARKVQQEIAKKQEVSKKTRKERQVKVVKSVKQTPSHFTTDQRQQKKKLERLIATQYGQDVFRYAKHSGMKYGVDADLILAIVMTESGFDQYAKNGNSYGLMQLSDNTSASKLCSNLYNPRCNIDASTRHFAGLQAKYKGDTRLALAAYNAGGGAVDSSLRRTGDIPKCTYNYVYKVRKYREVIRMYRLNEV